MNVVLIEGVVDQAITATEANCQFSRLLGEVREGSSYVVTSHGKPVARIVPFAPGNGTRLTGAAHEMDGPTPEQLAARRELIERLKAQPIIDIDPWSRGELYER